MKNPAELLSTIKLTVLHWNSSLIKELLSIEEKAIAEKNIIAIIEICQKNYSNQLFYGGSALNRLALLDPEIAKLLTPETIIELYINHDNRDKEEYIIMNSQKWVTFIGVLDYGFKSGLEVLKFLPNNEKNYDIKAYTAQQEKFTENTLKIVKNLESVAKRLKIDLSSLPEEKVSEFNLLERFEAIQKRIDRMMRRKMPVINVSHCSTEDIYKQMLSGFSKLCLMSGVEIKENKITKPDTLSAVVSCFLKDPAVFLNGKVSHLFYDPTHLTACFSDKTLIEIGDRSYFLREILHELLSTLEAMLIKNPRDQNLPIIKKQFTLRLQIIESNFPENFHTQITVALGFQRISDFIFNLFFFMDKFGLDIQKNMPCYEFANRMEAFLMAQTQPKEENLKLEYEDKFSSIKRLESILGILCDPKKTGLFSIKKDKLYFTSDKEEDNLSDIMCRAASVLSHLALNEKMAQFFIEEVPKFSDMFDDKVTQTQLNKLRLDYDISDEKESATIDLIACAEKLAIRYYARNNFYKTIQFFLRTGSFILTGKLSKIELSKLDPPGLTKLITPFILVIVFATAGLTRTAKPAEKYLSKTELIYRMEYSSKDSKEKPDFLQNRLTSLAEKKPVVSSAFISCSHSPAGLMGSLNSLLKRDKLYDYCIYITLISQCVGDRQAHYTVDLYDSAAGHFPHEDEVLAAPGRPLFYTQYFADPGSQNLVFIGNFCPPLAYRAKTITGEGQKIALSS